MRILLIAYEFPPVASAQSLRWSYLSEWLVAAGCSVDVVAPDLSTGPNVGAAPPTGVRIERCFAGPYVGFANKLGRWLARRPETSGASTDELDFGIAARGPSRVERAYRAGRRVLDRLLFPDVRTEWRCFAARRLRDLIGSNRYDVIVASHEPAVDIELGIAAARDSAIPLVVDMADPVLAPYTPRRWRSRSARLERRSLQAAKLVLVTAPSARSMLLERHGDAISARIEVLPQGFPAGRPPLSTSVPKTDCLRLLFAGTLYAGWRDPCALLDAVSRLDGVELCIAGTASGLDPVAIGARRNVRWLGRRSHREILALQHESDVLVNIANADAVQVPGKLYEYIGAGKPILHLSAGVADDGAALLAELGGGSCVPNEASAIEAAIHMLLKARREGTLARLVVPAERAAIHSWEARGKQLLELLGEVAGSPAGRTAGVG